VRSGDQLDRLDLLGIAGHEPVLVGVGADHVSEHPGITGI